MINVLLSSDLWHLLSTIFFSDKQTRKSFEM